MNERRMLPLAISSLALALTASDDLEARMRVESSPKQQRFRHGRYTPSPNGSTWTPKKKRNRRGRDPRGRSGYMS